MKRGLSPFFIKGPMKMNRFILLGAVSDVACRYVYPALTELEDSRQLPDGFVVRGITKNEWTDIEQLRRHIGKRVAERRPDIDQKSLHNNVLGRLEHASGDLRELPQLRKALGPLGRPVTLYLGLPPDIAETVVANLCELGLPAGSRIILEKPFGRDRQSAERLNLALHRILPEESIFRLDHFLGKQTAQNILGVRFANRVLEQLWNRDHVDRVEIIWEETRAPEGRIGYYDSAGALKDMIQNHLLQLMCLLAMEPPPAITEQELRDRKMALLASVLQFNADEIASHTVRGRYTAGRIEDGEVPNYVDQPGVDPARRTETFAQVRLFVDNQRWKGVPFVLRTGKALASDRQELSVFFKPPTHTPFLPSNHTKLNRLCMRLKPDRVGLRVNINGPGNPLEAEPTELETKLAPDRLSPYATLISDVLIGDPMFFIRNDEAEEAWKIIDPIVTAWANDRVPLRQYQAGSHGPVAIAWDGAAKHVG